MTDLNSLDQFEQDLKKLLEERKQMDFGGSYCHAYADRDDQANTNYTFMCVQEHGQPYNKTYYQGQQIMTRMAIREHGQPYIKPQTQGQKRRTKMVIREHGQPYNKRPTNND